MHSPKWEWRGAEQLLIGFWSLRSGPHATVAEGGIEGDLHFRRRFRRRSSVFGVLCGRGVDGGYGIGVRCVLPSYLAYK